MKVQSNKVLPVQLQSSKDRSRIHRAFLGLKAARWFWMSLLIFSITRFGVGLTAYLGAPLILDQAATLYHLRPPVNTVIDVLGSRWDTGFYVSIVEEGYQYEGVPLPSVAFFPLLPLMMRVVTWLGVDTVLA